MFDGARFPLGPFVPYEGNPILRPQGGTWESANLYNPAALVDGGRRTLQHQMIAAGGGGDLEALFDKSEVLVEVAVELRGEPVVFEGQFQLRGEGVVGGGGQMPVQVLVCSGAADASGDGLRLKYASRIPFRVCDNLAFN